MPVLMGLGMLAYGLVLLFQPRWLSSYERLFPVKASPFSLRLSGIFMVVLGLYMIYFGLWGVS